MNGVSERAAASLAGLPDFLIYLTASGGLVALFVTLYVLVTPQREITLIRQGNQAAALGLGGAILGFAIPLAMSITQSHNLIDMLVWSGIALIVQIGAFFLCGLVIRHGAERITDGDTATATLLAFVSVGAGLVSAACMSYPGP